MSALSNSWASRIRAAWQKSVDGIIEVGRLLIEAKEALPHGEFIAMVESELPFREHTARRLMAIARDERLSNGAHGLVLPPSWRTLYAISRLDDATFEAKIADGTINPGCQRKDIASCGRLLPRARLRPRVILRMGKAFAKQRRY